MSIMLVILIHADDAEHVVDMAGDGKGDDQEDKGRVMTTSRIVLVDIAE